MRTMLEKTIRLIKYCQNINAGMNNIPAPHLVATEDQGSLTLNSPKHTPQQVVISLPQAALAGSCNNIKGPHTFIIFVLEKGKEQTRTQSDNLYLRTAEMLEQLLTKIVDDISGNNSSGQCPLLCGMELVAVEIIPEAGRFGGWNGWSATLTLE